MDEVRFSAGVTSVKRSRRRLSRLFARTAVATTVAPVAIALLAATLAPLHVHVLDTFALDAWIVGWLFCTPLSSLMGLVAGVRRREHATTVEVDEDALHLRAKGTLRRIPRRTIAGALRVMDARDEVEIALEGGDVLHVELANPAAAGALIASLGFGAEGRRTVVPLGEDHDVLSAGCWGVLLGVLVTTLATCGLGILAASTHGLQSVFGYLIGLVFIGACVFFTRLLSPQRVVVGTDGVIVERPFRKKFIPLARISNVYATSDGVMLALATDGPLRTLWLKSSRRERTDALHDRIVEAMTIASQTNPEAASALVSRGGRSLREWREALRRLAATAGGYRGERVSVDALLRTVESTAAPLEPRLGAAMAIGLADDAEAKKRLRIAVEGIANEKVRVALERAADGGEDEAAIEEALVAEQKAARS